MTPKAARRSGIRLISRFIGFLTLCAGAGPCGAAGTVRAGGGGSAALPPSIEIKGLSSPGPVGFDPGFELSLPLSAPPALIPDPGRDSPPTPIETSASLEPAPAELAGREALRAPGPA